MDLLEKWGHRADAVVACLTAACALALGLYGMMYMVRCQYVMPFVLLFFLLELVWWLWICRSLLGLMREGYFTHAAWHVAVALPLTVFCTLSLSCMPHQSCSHLSPFLTDRILQHIAWSLHWWCTEGTL